MDRKHKNLHFFELYNEISGDLIEGRSKPQLGEKATYRKCFDRKILRNLTLDKTYQNKI